MFTLVQFVNDNFPSTIQDEFFEYISQFDTTIWTWKDFTQHLSDFVQKDEDNMSVTTSSTWAVCQQFLGNLSGSDLEYADCRGGIWAFSSGKITSVREVLTELQNEFPY